MKHLRRAASEVDVNVRLVEDHPAANEPAIDEVS